MYIYTYHHHCYLYWYIFYTWHSSFVRCYCWAILNLIIIIPTDYYMEPCPFVVSSVIRMYPVYPCIMYPAGFVVCMRNYYLKLTYSQKQLKFRLKSLPSDGIHYYILQWMHHVCDCKWRRFASVCVIRLNPNAHALQRIICRLRLAYINKKHFRLVCIPTIRTYRYY